MSVGRADCCLNPSVSHGRWNRCESVNWHCSLYVLVFTCKLDEYESDPKISSLQWQNQMFELAGYLEDPGQGKHTKRINTVLWRPLGVLYLVSPGYSMILQSFLYFKTSLITNLTWDRQFRKPSYSFSHLILITILQSRRCQRKAGSLCHEGEGQGLEQHGPLALGGQPWELRHLPHGPQRQLPGHAEWWLPAAAGPARLLLPRASHPQEARSTADTVGPCAPEQQAHGMRLVLPTAPLRSEAAPPPRGLWVAPSPLASTLWALTGTRDALVLVFYWLILVALDLCCCSQLSLLAVVWGEGGLLSSCAALATHWGGFSCKTRALECLGFSSCGSQTLEGGLNRCGTQA